MLSTDFPNCVSHTNSYLTTTKLGFTHCSVGFLYIQLLFPGKFQGSPLNRPIELLSHYCYQNHPFIQHYFTSWQETIAIILSPNIFATLPISRNIFIPVLMIPRYVFLHGLHVRTMAEARFIFKQGYVLKSRAATTHGILKRFLKIGPLACPETWVWNYHSTMHNMPKERRFQNSRTLFFTLPNRIYKHHNNHYFLL